MLDTKGNTTAGLRKLQFLLLHQLCETLRGKFILGGGFATFCCGKTTDFSDLDVYMKVSKSSSVQEAKFVSRFADGLRELAVKAWRSVEGLSNVDVKLYGHLSIVPCSTYPNVFKLLVEYQGCIQPVADFCIIISSSGDHPTRKGHRLMCNRSRRALDYNIKKLYTETTDGMLYYQPMVELIQQNIIHDFDLDVCKSISIVLPQSCGFMASVDVSGKTSWEQMYQLSMSRQSEKTRTPERALKYVSRLSPQLQILYQQINEHLGAATVQLEGLRNEFAKGIAISE